MEIRKPTKLTWCCCVAITKATQPERDLAIAQPAELNFALSLSGRVEHTIFVSGVLCDLVNNENNNNNIGKLSEIPNFL